MDYLTRLKNFVGNLVSGAGHAAAPIAQEVQQIPQQVQGFGQNLLSHIGVPSVQLPHVQPPNLPQVGQNFQNWLNTPLPANSPWNGVNTGLQNAEKAIFNIPVVGAAVKAPFQVGQQGSELLLGGMRQINDPNAPPSHLPIIGTPIPAGVAGRAKMLLGVTMPLAAGAQAIGNATEDALNRVPVVNKTPIPGIVGFGASLLTPGGQTADVGKIEEAAANAGKLDPFIASLEADAKNPFISELEKNQIPTKKIGTILPTDAQAQAEGTLLGGEGIGKPADNVVQSFRDWVNARHATPLQSMQAQKEFSNLDNLGFEGISRFQAGDRTGGLDKVQQYFDKKYADLQKAGVDVNFKENYLPQLWNNSPEEVAQVFGERHLGLRPSFSLQSIFKDYQEGKEAGLTPRFTKVSDLVGWYEGRANKAIADQQFFNGLAKDGVIQPSGKASAGWKSLDPDHFPKLKATTAEGNYSGTYSAPKPIADMVNSYLNPSPEGILKNISGATSKFKRTVMSVGVPGTAINPHGFNELATSAMAFKNPVKGVVTAASRMIAPKLGSMYTQSHLNDAVTLVKHGMELKTENEAFAPTDKLSKFSQLFEKPLFQQVIPSLKVQYGKELHDTLVKKGLSDEQAWTQAAHDANNFFGGINTDELGKDPTAQQLYKSVFFAPDWMKSRLNIGGNAIKAILSPTDPKGVAYRTAIRNLMGVYATANIVNHKLSGHWMYQNDPGHAFDIEVGFTSDGQRRYVRPFGTAADFIKVPVDVIQGLTQGDPSVAARTLRNRLSTPLGVITDLVANVNPYGQNIRGTADSPMSNTQAAANIAGDVAGSFLPSIVRAPFDLAGGKGLEQTIAQDTGLPVRYSGGNSTKSIVTKGLAAGESQPQIDQEISKMVQAAQTTQDVRNSLNTKEQNAWDTVKGIGSDPQSEAVKNSIFRRYPNVFNAERDRAVTLANGDPNQIDPLYTSPYAQEYLTYEQLNNTAPGSAEEKQYLKNHPEVLNLLQQRSSYFSANPIPTQSDTGYIPTTQASPYVQQQLNAKNFNDPQVQQYLSTHLQEINTKRAAVGLDPIDTYGNIQGSKNFATTFKKSPKSIASKFKITGIKKASKAKVVNPLKGLKLGSSSTTTKVASLHTNLPAFHLKTISTKTKFSPIPKPKRSTFKIKTTKL